MLTANIAAGVLGTATGYRLALVALLSTVPAAASAQNWTLTFINDNDAYFNIGDRHYTNGLYASLTTPPRAGGNGFNRRYSVFLGQSIFTPDDLSLANPDPDDRPYAGWLYGGVKMYNESAAMLDRVELKLGIVGPSSGADAIQRWWHSLHVFGGVPPVGWSRQLGDEPGVVVSAQRIWRVPLVDGLLDGELLPEANLSLGNVFTYAGVGASLRAGRNLRADWGPARIEPALQGSDFVDRDAVGSFAWYVFAGIEGRAIARNIFLDGNTFRDSHSVNREPWVADFQLGVATTIQGVRISYMHVFRTKEFEEQREPDRFGAVSVSMRF